MNSNKAVKPESTINTAIVIFNGRMIDMRLASNDFEFNLWPNVIPLTHHENS